MRRAGPVERTLALSVDPEQSAAVKRVRAVKTALNVLLRMVAFIVVAYLALIVLAMYWPRLSGGTRGKHTREHRYFATQFQAGDTNASCWRWTGSATMEFTFAA